MNTDSVVHPDEEPTQPIVQWFPRAGAAQAAPAAAAAAGAIVFGVLVYAGYALARSAMGGRRGGDLTVDRLVVRRLTVLED
jgi:hypothetical protein